MAGREYARLWGGNGGSIPLDGDIRSIYWGAKHHSFLLSSLISDFMSHRAYYGTRNNGAKGERKRRTMK